jgi:hypothetical protein
MDVALPAVLPAAGPQEARRRRLFTWAGALVVAIYVPRAIYTATMSVFDPDVWWVAAAGREIMKDGAVPTQNLFSFVEPAHPWVMHEWLLGPAYALLLQRFGPAVFALVALGTFLAGVVIVVRSTIGRARFPLVGLLLASTALCCFSARFLTARPPHVALLFALLLTPLAFAPRFPRTSILVAVVAECLWTNVHGSFPLGIVILAFGALEQPADRTNRILGTALAALATFVNPYGLSLHRLVLGYVGGDDGIYGEIHQRIVEFQSIFRSTAVGPVELVVLAALSVGVVGMFRVPKYRARAVFCAALIAMSIRQARHCELAGLLSCILLVPYLDDVFERKSLASLTDSTLRRQMSLLFVVPSIVLVVGTFVVQYRSRTTDEWLGDTAPVVRLIDAAPDDAHAFVPFHDAGYAIWYGWPRGIRVYFDPRNDCYSVAAFRSFSAFEFGPLGADAGAKLAAAGADTAIVRTGTPLAERLAQDDRRWTRVRADGDYFLYRRVD